jgi:transcriptional regulator with XRE-family HTH domain
VNKIYTVTANFETNLRRLLYFHHPSAREAAQVLGVTEQAVSAWLTGKRRPNANGLMAIDRVYHVGPRELDLSPADFAQLLADRERMAEAEQNVTVNLGRGPEHVIPLNRKRG